MRQRMVPGQHFKMHPVRSVETREYVREPEQVLRKDCNMLVQPLLNRVRSKIYYMCVLYCNTDYERKRDCAIKPTNSKQPPFYITRPIHRHVRLANY